jgi:pilus assembly protein CpaB
MNAPDFMPATKNLPPAARRSVGRSRSLPSGRAAIGALLVVMSGLGLATATRKATAEPSTRFAVATRDVPAGNTLQASDIQLLTMKLAPNVAQRSFTNLSLLVGAVSTNSLSAGELIQYSAVQKGGPELRAMSFPIDAARALNGRLDPDDRLDVVATNNIDGTDKTLTVLRNLRLISVSGASLDPGSSSELVLTVAIANPDDQAVLAEAVNNGNLFVVRANDTRSTTTETATPETATPEPAVRVPESSQP